MKNIFILVGPSGSGKTLLSNYMHLKYHATEFVSTTTRLPRDGEVNGVDYHFVTNETFKEMMEKKELVEHSEYAGNHYGLTKDAVFDALAKSDSCVAVMDMHGANAIRYLFKDDETVNVVCIFIHAKISTLFLRMVSRGDKNEKIAERLDNMIENHEFFNGGSCEYTIFNNGDIEDAEKEMDEIAEKILKKN